jgi:hypothetical protein
VTHDWNTILADAGEDPVAPSAMRWLDPMLDATSARRKYWEKIEWSCKHDRYKITDEFRTNAATVDLATMNLIATNLGGDYDKGGVLRHYHLTNAFGPGLSVSDIRRYILLAVLEESATRRNTVPRINSLTTSKEPMLLDYPISTDRGLAAQHGLICFMLALYEPKNYDMVEAVLGDDETGQSAYGWFSDRNLIEYVLTNPARAELIAHTMVERESTDLDFIRSIMDSDAPSLAEGLL